MMSIVLGFSKTDIFDIGCVYIDTCSTILQGKGKLNTHNFKNLPVGSTICLFHFPMFSKNRRARVNINATHVIKISFLLVLPLLRLLEYGYR